MDVSKHPIRAEIPDPSVQTGLARQIAWVLLPTFALVLLSLIQPDIPLDSALADIAVRLSDSSSWGQLPALCSAMLLVLLSRAGLGPRRRVIEGAVIVAVMLLALAGNALLNERVIKPAFAMPRPNIVALAGSGALGAGIPDSQAFYALGDKDARRLFLRERLAGGEKPALTPRVREHWIYETGYSFPSGHAVASMTFASMMVALGLSWLGGWRRRVTSVVIPAWAVAVAHSRPLLDVHNGIDVAAGTLLGFAWGLVSFLVIRWTVGKLGGAR